MSTLVLKAPAETLDAGVFKLLVAVMKNGSHSDPKYKSINLTGKAGSKLQASDEAMTLLTAAGWVIDGANLVFPASASADILAAFHADLQTRFAAIAPAATAATAAPSVTAPSAPLSLKQQARLVEEQKEKDARAAVHASKKKKTGLSMKQQARIAEEEVVKRERIEAVRIKAETVKKIEADKWTRQNDPNWSAAAAGDKANGKDMSTFRQKVRPRLTGVASDDEPCARLNSKRHSSCMRTSQLANRVHAVRGGQRRMMLSYQTASGGGVVALNDAVLQGLLTSAANGLLN